MDPFDRTVQYYGIATTTILFYEYFAMLPDEVGFLFPAALRPSPEADTTLIDPICVVTK